MGLFGFGKNKDVIDLAERYRKQKEREENLSKSSGNSSSQGQSYSGDSSASPFAFFDSGTSTSSTNSSDSEEYVDMVGASSEKKKRLAKRILDMTTKLEDISNQIYHLQQRIEVLERKLDVKRFD